MFLNNVIYCDMEIFFHPDLIEIRNETVLLALLYSPLNSPLIKCQIYLLTNLQRLKIFTLQGVDIILHKQYLLSGKELVDREPETDRGENLQFLFISMG